MDTIFIIMLGLALLLAGLCAIGWVANFIEDKQNEMAAQRAKDFPPPPDLPGLKAKAEKGDISARYELGVAYYNGRGAPQDYTEAFKWIRSAAGAGNAEAQAVLGAMYYAGHGHPQNLVLAHVYFNLAASKGHTGAIDGRDVITPLLSGPSLEEAHRLAREWAPEKS